MITPTPKSYADYHPYNGWSGLWRDITEHPLAYLIIGLILIGLIVMFLAIGLSDQPPSGVNRGRFQGPERRYPFQAWLDDEES